LSTFLLFSNLPVLLSILRSSVILLEACLSFCTTCLVVYHLCLSICLLCPSVCLSQTASVYVTTYPYLCSNINTRLSTFILNSFPHYQKPCRFLDMLCCEGISYISRLLTMLKGTVSKFMQTIKLK